ncbi:MAG: hypothetical protein HWN68_00390 [Desulfobacterales bacterium]|nr:hypothetical protein [Desulfobacterales bacterium]
MKHNAAGGLFTKPSLFEPEIATVSGLIDQSLKRVQQVTYNNQISRPAYRGPLNSFQKTQNTSSIDQANSSNACDNASA